jgi:TPR repeat protein
MYENGDGVPQDDYQATKYYYNAVANLNGRKYKYQAAEGLIKLYAEGRGLSKTNQESEDFIDRALADKAAVIQQLQGVITTARAEFNVGRLYYQGTLVSQDLVEAAARFHVAADEGLDDASNLLVQLDTKMSTDQKDTAKKRASGLKANLNQQRWSKHRQRFMAGSR